jgi:hypothetical protein
MKKELCLKLVIYKDYTKMYGQQYIKKNTRRVNKQLKQNNTILGVNTP